MSVITPTVTAASLGKSFDAVGKAARMQEIGFPEFTAKLINDTFDALIAANIRQQEAYATLFATITDTLTNYVNNTKDEINADTVLDFIKGALSADLVGKIIEVTTKGTNVTINPDEATAINTSIAPINYKYSDNEAEHMELLDNCKIVSGSLNSQIQKIIDACAIRIAENKYAILRKIMDTGVLRLVVESGLIETKIVFRTFSNMVKTTNVEETMKVKSSESYSSLLWGLIRSSNTAYSTIKPVTAQGTETGEEDITITGTVKINFKTDYKPLLSEL